MPKSRIILCLGFFIALLPVLGFPNSWDHFFDTASGLLIVLLSVLISVDKRLMQKAKAEKRVQRKRALVSTPVAEEAPTQTPEPIFVPEPIAEIPAEPARMEEMPAEVASAPSSDFIPARPRRKRRINVVDGDASQGPAMPPEHNDIPQF